MTDIAERHTCCALVLIKGTFARRNPCGKTAKIERDGKWYCGTHDPVAQAEKRAARNAEWGAKWARETRERKFRIASWEAIRTIAAGHNDPQALAREVLAILDEGDKP